MSSSPIGDIAPGGGFLLCMFLFSGLREVILLSPPCGEANPSFFPGGGPGGGAPGGGSFEGDRPPSLACGGALPEPLLVAESCSIFDGGILGAGPVGLGGRGPCFIVERSLAARSGGASEGGGFLFERGTSSSSSTAKRFGGGAGGLFRFGFFD